MQGFSCKYPWCFEEFPMPLPVALQFAHSDVWECKPRLIFWLSCFDSLASAGDCGVRFEVSSRFCEYLAVPTEYVRYSDQSRAS